MSLRKIISQSSDHNLPLLNRLSIYSKSSHFIQKYSQGTTLVYLPKFVDVSSIVIVDETGVILPFSYVSETLLDKTYQAINDKLDVIVTKNGINYTGKIISLDSDNVMINTSNKIISIRDYDSFAISEKESRFK